MYHSCRHVVIGGVFQSPPWSKIPELRSLVDQTVDHPCHRRLGPYHPRARPCDRKSPHDSEGAAGRLYWIRGHAEGHFRLTELPLEKVQKLLNIPEDPASLNTAEEQMAVEQIVDLRTPSLDDVCATSAMQVVARQLVECLSPKETEVIRTASRLPQRPPRSSGRLRHRS